VHLAPDDYRFDFFYLTEGSEIILEVYQTEGVSNVFIIQGETQLRLIQGNVEYDDGKGEDYILSKDALVKHYVSPGDNGHASMRYRVKQSDMYVLVYENASKLPGDLSVFYHVVLTTYNLDGHTPACVSANSRFWKGEPCSIRSHPGKTCLLVHAESGWDSGVIVTISGNRNWVVLILCSLIPLAIGIFGLVWFYTKHCRKKKKAAKHEESPPLPPYFTSCGKRRRLF
jgi:hypothetical protein